MSKKIKKDATYFLIKEILFCFPNKVGGNLVRALNGHRVSKELTRQILKDEIQEKKPQFRILAGALILQNDFLRWIPRIALYEVIEVVDALKYCFQNDQRKTIKKLSAQTIIRLFVTLYFEFIIIPLRKKEGKIYINEFKKFFTKEDMIKIMKTDGIYLHFIFREQGVKSGPISEIDARIKAILDEFYSS